MVFLIAFQAIICSGDVAHTAYNPVFEYDVPVASQPVVYASPAVHTGHYGSYAPSHYRSYAPSHYGSYGGAYGSYAVHTTPAVSHTFSQTQTHPVSYVKPVSILCSCNSKFKSDLVLFH